jgi:hypothetical protein
MKSILYLRICDLELDNVLDNSSSGGFYVAIDVEKGKLNRKSHGNTYS